MKFHSLYLIVFLIFLVSSCAKEKEKEKISIVEEESLESQMIKTYNEGLNELDKGDIIYAAKKFNEAELLYPQSIWAPRAALMAAYAYYSEFYYTDAIIELEKYLDKYKNHQRRDYAYYLLALCHYNQIVDETKDLNEILKAKKYFEFIIKKYPDTEFALDSEFKLELIKELLASKEMYLARYYIEREKWIHAALLGYNYQSSKWYEESYKILNKNYKKISKTKNKKKEESIIQKFKDLLK